MKFIKKNYKEKKADLKRASTTLNIELNEKEFIKQVGSNWVISHQSAMRNRFLEMPELLVENANSDGILFEDIFHYEAQQRDISPLCFDTQNGGSGGDLQNQFPLRLTKPSKKIVICIGDRDSFLPQENKPKIKLKKLNDIISNKNSIGFAELTPGTEIENFIPTSVLRELYYSDEDIQKIEIIENLLKNQGDAPERKCLYLYLDLKHGFDVHENKGGRFTPALQNWIIKKHRVNKSEIGSYVLSGFDEHIIKKYSKSKEAKDQFRNFVASKYWKRHFRGWINPIIWYLCGERKSRF